MHIRYQDRKTGMVTLAYCERHTLSRTMRRYKRGYDLLGGNFMARPVRLAGSHTNPQKPVNGYLPGLVKKGA